MVEKNDCIRWAVLAIIALLSLCSCVVRNEPPPQPMFGPGSANYGGQSYGAQQYAPPSYRPAPQPVQYSSPPAPPIASPTPISHASGAWRMSSADRQQSLGHGATLHEFTASNGAESAEVQVVIFDSKQCALRVVDQPSSKAGGNVIGSSLRAQNALAGVNGGFFHPDFSVLGEVIAGGHKMGKWTSTPLVSGSVLMVGKEPYLVWNSEFLGDGKITDLIQGGPRLIDGGVPVSTLNRTKSAARTFVATDSHRTWAIGVVRSTSLGGLGDLLAARNVLPGLQVSRALNLDGGHSTAFWAKTPGGREISRPGWSTVRNYLAIIAR